MILTSLLVHILLTVVSSNHLFSSTSLLLDTLQLSSIGMKPETPFFEENRPRFLQKGLFRGRKGKKEEKEASVKPETPFFEENRPRFLQKGLFRE